MVADSAPSRGVWAARLKADGRLEGAKLPITLSPTCVLCGPRSPLAPLAYALGVAMLLAFYGTRGMDEWEQKLQGDGLLQAAVQPVLPAAQT